VELVKVITVATILLFLWSIIGVTSCATTSDTSKVEIQKGDIAIATLEGIHTEQVPYVSPVIYRVVVELRPTKFTEAEEYYPLLIT